MKSAALLAAILGPAALAGCTHHPECGAVADYASARPAALECAAASGDKFAQLELGVRYETGDGVPRDLRRAERLYARAARTETRSRAVYSAPVGDERHGRIIPVSAAATEPGLPEAQERLRRLRQARSQR